MNKRKSKEPKEQKFVPMAVVNPNAAGIDVGDTLHAVAVPTNRDDVAVRTYGTMNCDLKLIVEWLEKCGIERVALESTGVYWKPLFSYLTPHGFEVYLVNARHVRNVTGRKSDQSDIWFAGNGFIVQSIAESFSMEKSSDQHLRLLFLPLMLLIL